MIRGPLPYEFALNNYFTSCFNLIDIRSIKVYVKLLRQIINLCYPVAEAQLIKPFKLIKHVFYDTVWFKVLQPFIETQYVDFALYAEWQLATHF